MRKVCALIVLAILFALATDVFADPKIEFNVYKCRVCGKEFRSLRGDDLDDKKFTNGPDQLKYLFQFWKYDKNFQECKSGLKWHNFEKKTTSSMQVSNLANSSFSEYVAAVKDGRTLNGVKLVEWECVLCKKHFFFLNDENPNIRDWEQQPDKIRNLKGRGISKCSAPMTYGHAFTKKKTTEAKSYDLAKNAENIYWVKN